MTSRLETISTKAHQKSADDIVVLLIELDEGLNQIIQGAVNQEFLSMEQQQSTSYQLDLFTTGQVERLLLIQTSVKM